MAKLHYLVRNIQVSISHKPNMCHFENFEGYIVLENESGQKKVLLPTRKILNNKYQPYTDQRLKSNTEENPLTPLVVYDLDSHQTEPVLIPAPGQTHAILMLIYCYLSQGNMKKHWTLLKAPILYRKGDWIKIRFYSYIG